ncbi:MAG TPA: ATP-binding protein [Saprospiraceae bacterium]|nr:ATP-binding protein [Saprospiraceae bacterium]
MVKIQVVFISMFLFAFNLYGQKINEFIGKNDQLFKEDKKEAIRKMDSLYTIFKGKIAPSDEGEILYSLCKYYVRSGNQDSALTLAQKGMDFVKKHDIADMTADFANVLGGSYFHLGQQDSGVHYMIIAAESLEKKGDKEKSAYVYNNLGNVFLDDTDFSKAIYYFQEALAKLPNDGSNVFAGTISGNLSFAYVSLDSLVLAEKYAIDAIRIGEKNEDNTAILYGKLTLADVANKKGNREEALIKYNESYQLATDIEDDYKKALCAASLAEFYANSNSNLAIKYGLESYNYNKENLPRFLPQSTLVLARAYESNKDFTSSSRFYKEYANLIDSIKSVDYNTLKLDLLEKYETAQKSQLISEQKSIISANSLKITRLFAGLIATALALFILLLWWKLQKNKAAQKLTELKHEKEQAIFNSLVEGEQNERIRLAKELHDGLANEIAALKMQTSISNLKTPNDTLETIERRLDQLHESTRNIAHNMLPKVFMDDGLMSSIKALCADYDKVIAIDVDIKSYQKNKSRSFELFIYRLTQEIIGNAVKYANASKILVIIHDEGGMFSLKVKDDGIGIDQEKAHSGFSFIKDRLKEVEGFLQVNSDKGNGTEIDINIKYGV